MSFEQILLIVFFIVVPLVQLVMRLLKQQGNSPDPSAGPPRPAKRPPPPVRHRPLPQTLPQIAAAAMAVPAQAQSEPAKPPVRRAAQPAATGVGFRSTFDLRRAVVLMTLIGPCRAASPWRDPDGLQVMRTSWE